MDSTSVQDRGWGDGDQGWKKKKREAGSGMEGQIRD